MKLTILITGCNHESKTVLKELFLQLFTFALYQFEYLMTS
jgi:hypothetical protein